ncbi:membrane protein [Tolypocladium ophioglossoides CBS 100239]|uniref:Membrane protein n=1 Tax=Tolypocladium ophioglossoides (strain CBS 100239) TaxID=1163406 RepID=A0A0L0NLG6_TOLOC|nr:membrane protein [Tolypocladium ophioglossoides CBS 100239]
MEASPLTRQPPPEVFTPKIVQLYSSLFKVCLPQPDSAPARGPALPARRLILCSQDKSEGFWREFFLLRPDRPTLRNILSETTPSDVLLLESHTRDFFGRAVETIKTGHGLAPLHALDTLTIFLSILLSKKYPHPSSDIITVLAGLDHIDTVFTDFVSTLDGIVRNGTDLDLRHKAVEVLLAVTAGAYQTTLLTYLIQRDLFPSVMKFIHESETPGQVLEPFTLLGLLANYNKFEFQNPYQLRLNDFVNESSIQKIIHCVGYTCQALRLGYIDIQDDLPEGWTFSSALNIIGLGAILPGPKPEKKPVYDAETAKQMLSTLPGENAAILLATYDFCHANKLFCFNLVTILGEKGKEPPIASYVSLTSYLLQHAHLSHRATYYANLNLMVFRLLIEDPVICKRICSDESKVPVRLCRQRQPFLPLLKGERVFATCVLDTMIDGINHNLRRRLDISLYTLCVGILLRIISYLSRSRTRLHYHWPEFFRSLLSLIRFLTTYTSDLKDLSHIDTLLDHVVNLLALSLSAGEAFLPTPAAYDDLFYKVVESGEVLTKFKENYGLQNRKSSSIDTLISVSTHYKQMLSEGGGSAKKKPSNLTTHQVTEVIKQGYETLSIQAKEGLDTWDMFREADERTLLKKMARASVGDVRVMVERQIQ